MRTNKKTIFDMEQDPDDTLEEDGEIPEMLGYFE